MLRAGFDDGIVEFVHRNELAVESVQLLAGGFEIRVHEFRGDVDFGDA